MPALTQDRPTATEPLQPQEPHTILVTIEDGTVDWVYTDLNVRVIVIEPNLIPDELCSPVREAMTLSLKDAKLPRAFLSQWERDVATTSPRRGEVGEQSEPGEGPRQREGEYARREVTEMD